MPMVCAWYFSQSDCNIAFSTTKCCSNVSIERTVSITFVIILDLIHLAAWSDLPSFRKRIHSLRTRGSIVSVLEVNVLEDVEEISCEWWLCVEIVGMISCFLCLKRLYVVIVCVGCIILGGDLGTQTRIVLIFVCYIWDRSCC